MANDYIKPYIVQIKGRLGNGSGVLVKDENGKYYIFTAKHNFKSTENQKVKEIEIADIKEDIEFGEVEVISYHTVEVNDAIGLDDLSIDFVVLVVNENNFEYLNNLSKEEPLEPLKIYNDKFNKCIVSGYPRTKISTDAIYLDCKYQTGNKEYEKKDDYKHTFKVSSNSPLNRSGITEVNTISGISGGGVFVEGEDEKIHLVGIEIEYIDIHNLVCVSLKDVIDDINKKLDVPIQFASSDCIEIEKVDSEVNYNIDVEEIEIIKDDKKLGTITLKTVPVEVYGKVLNVSIYPVTFKEYDLFCDDTNYKKPKSYSFQFPRENYPVVNVSWDDAISYCDWLTNKSQEFKYTLPSSEVWEKIAKLNKIETSKLDDYIWHQKNTKTINRVGIKKAGLLGIHDMYGNIWEWCDDNYDNENKIIKGETFNHTFYNLNMKMNYFLQNETKKHLGFRIIANKII